MRVVADLHVHSKYSMATSKEMDVGGISKWAKIKGIDVVGTGDFTHPAWVKEMEGKLTKRGGIYEYNGTFFIPSAEISTVFSVGRKVKKVHTVVLAPDFEIVKQINEILGKRGNLEADGRPTLGMSAEELAEIVMGISEKCMVIPAHIWTPWFGALGAKSGFDSIEECYGKMSRKIYAVETGLSSDPPMNWRVSSLDRYALVSNSDAHSPRKLGREANVFELERIGYEEICSTIRKKDKEKFKFTYEFYPEEGKYHYDGHRNCSVCMCPEDSMKRNNICPVCKRKVTIGVMHRVEKLSDRKKGEKRDSAIPYKSIAPLPEIISKALGKGEKTKAVEEEYGKIIDGIGDEFSVFSADEKEIGKYAERKVAEAIRNVVNGKVDVIPGYDGVFGEVEIPGEKEGQSTLGEF